MKSTFPLPSVLSLHLILPPFALIIQVTSFDTWHYSHGSQLEGANRIYWKVIKIKGQWKERLAHGFGSKGARLWSEPCHEIALWLCASHFISLYCSFHVFKIGTGVFAAHCSSPPANKTWCIRANWAGRHRSFSQESCVLEQKQTVRTGQNRDTLFFEGLQIAPVPFITDHCRWALMRSPSCLCNTKYNLWYSPRAASPWERKAGFSML